VRHLVHAALAPARLLALAARALIHLAVHAVRLFVRFVRRVARGLALALRRATAALTRLLRFARLLAHAAARLLSRVAAALVHAALNAVRLFARVVLRAVRHLALALPRATTALRRTPPPARPDDYPTESRNVAAAVAAWVPPLPQSSDEPPTFKHDDHDASEANLETDIVRLERRPPSTDPAEPAGCREPAWQSSSPAWGSAR
jgi:hypothetical protein